MTSNAALKRNPARSVPLAFAALAVLLLIAAALLAPAGAEAKKKNQRIVALTPFSANVMAELGVMPVAVGTLPVGNKNEARRAYHNKILKGVRQGKIRELSLTHGNDGPNKEQVAKLKPDLMFSERTWRASSRYFKNVAKIRVREDEPIKIKEFKKEIRDIGKAVGAPNKRIKKVQKKLAKRIKNTGKGKRKYRGKGSNPNRPRTLVLLGLGDRYMAFLNSSWGGDVVRRAGGRNVAGNLSRGGSSSIMVSGGFANISPEIVLQRDPQVIIVVPHGTPSQIPKIRQNMANDPTIRATNAWQNKRVFFSTDNSLLQPTTMIHKTMKKVRRGYLKNW